MDRTRPLRWLLIGAFRDTREYARSYQLNPDIVTHVTDWNDLRGRLNPEPPHMVEIRILHSATDLRGWLGIQHALRTRPDGEGVRMRSVP